MAINADTLKTTNRNRRATPDGSELAQPEENGHPWGIRAKPGSAASPSTRSRSARPASSQSSRITAPVRVRGSVPRPDAPRVPGSYAGKADVYSENARLLYEEAVTRQWSSATDIP